MTIPSGNVSSWTTAQIQGILATEIPIMYRQILQFSRSQFAALQGSQIASLLADQGPGVITGSWGDAASKFNTTQLGLGIKAQPVSFFTKISNAQWADILRWQPNLLSQLLPYLSIEQINSRNWYVITGNSYKFLSYFTASQIAQILSSQGSSILYGAWYDAPVNIDTGNLALAIAQQSPSFLASMTSAQWRQLFNMRPNLLVTMLPLLQPEQLRAVDWIASAAGTNYVANGNNAIAWGANASIRGYPGLLQIISGGYAVINVNSPFSVINLTNGSMWLYVTGAGRAGYTNFYGDITNDRVIDYANDEGFENVANSDFKIGATGFRSGSFINSTATFLKGASGQFIGRNGTVLAPFMTVKGNTVTLSGGNSIYDTGSNETYYLNGGGNILTNTQSSGTWFPYSLGDVINTSTGGNALNLIGATVNGNSNTINVLSNVVVNGDSNKISIANYVDSYAYSTDVKLAATIVNGNRNTVSVDAKNSAKIIGNSNTISLATGSSSTVSGQSNVVTVAASTSVSVTDTSAAANSVWVESGLSKIKLTGQYAAIYANSSLASTNKLTIDVTNLVSGTIYEYANENLAIIGNSNNHVRVLIQAMASFGGSAHQAEILTTGAPSSVLSSQYLTVLSSKN